MSKLKTKDLFAKVLFSSGGIATQIPCIDKSENPLLGILIDIGDGTILLF